MKTNLYRQLRFVVVIVAGIGIFAISGALLVAFWNEHLQREFLDALVMDEYQELLEHLKDHPGAPLPRAVQLRIWMEGHHDSDPLPDALRKLSPGTHHDVPLDDHVYHVLKTDTEGYPTYVAIETSSFSYQERWLQAALVGLAILDVPLAFFMGIWMVRQIAIPHERLASRVSELDPAKDTIHIGGDFQGLEVEQIARAIDQYQDRLRGFIDRERTFTAAASHELRTPLTALRSSAEVLHYDKRLDPTLQDYTQKMIQACIEMGNTLEGLMWLSREDQQPRPEILNLVAVVEEVVSKFPDRHIQVQRADRSRPDPLLMTLPFAFLTIVLSNLIRNACQFSPKESIIRIQLSDHEISIHNAGPPIPREELGRVMERFYRSPGSQGQGLGLHIASSICNRMQWQLSLDSDETGTTARIRLV